MTKNSYGLVVEDSMFIDFLSATDAHKRGAQVNHVIQGNIKNMLCCRRSSPSVTLPALRPTLAMPPRLLMCSCRVQMSLHHPDQLARRLVSAAPHLLQHQLVPIVSRAKTLAHERLVYL